MTKSETDDGEDALPDYVIGSVIQLTDEEKRPPRKNPIGFVWRWPKLDKPSKPR